MNLFAFTLSLLGVVLLIVICILLLINFIVGGESKTKKKPLKIMGPISINKKIK